MKINDVSDEEVDRAARLIQALRADGHHRLAHIIEDHMPFLMAPDFDLYKKAVVQGMSNRIKAVEQAGEHFDIELSASGQEAVSVLKQFESGPHTN